MELLLWFTDFKRALEVKKDAANKAIGGVLNWVGHLIAFEFEIKKMLNNAIQLTKRKWR